MNVWLPDLWVSRILVSWTLRLLHFMESNQTVNHVDFELLLIISSPPHISVRRMPRNGRSNCRIWNPTTRSWRVPYKRAPITWTNGKNSWPRTKRSANYWSERCVQHPISTAILIRPKELGVDDERRLFVFLIWGSFFFFPCCPKRTSKWTADIHRIVVSTVIRILTALRRHSYTRSWPFAQAIAWPSRLHDQNTAQ